MTDQALAQALGLALTGESGIVDVSAADPLAGLAASGWSPERILAHAQTARASGEVWPHPVPEELRRLVGSARLFAVLQQVQRDLGVFGRSAAPARARALTADERRLLSEVPPHHGH